MSFIAFLLLAGLLFPMQLLTAARLKRAEARVALLEAELNVRTGDGAFGSSAQGPAPETLPPAPETVGGLFERLVGGRLLIWIGGIAIAAAGIFLIRHSIDLVTPGARMIAAAALGLLLLAAGEYARAGRLLADDPRIGQSLVGAGIAILYAAAYGSYVLFALIGSGTASGLMLVITAGALALSLRHGAPTALMGLVGGLLTPLLVGDADAGALPVLAYLALLDAAIFAIAWRRKWGWLAAAAVAGSFAWTGYFILGPAEDAVAAGCFVAALAIAASLPRSEGRQVSLMQPLIIGLVELAALTARPDLELSGWLLFGAVSAASLPLSSFRPAQRFAPPAALLLALLLLVAKAVGGADPLLGPAAVATTLLFAVGSAASGARERPLRALTACVALAAPLLILRLLDPELLGRAAWGGTALALGLGTLYLLWLIRKAAREESGSDIGRFAAGSTAALLLASASYDLAPRELVSGAWLGVAVGFLLAGIRIPNKPLRFAALLLLTATILKVFLIDAAFLEGVLRILSFLALGLALIGIGKLYTKVLRAESGGRAGGDRAPAGHT